MDVNKLNDLANRIMKGGRGAGAGVGVLAAIGGAAYALYRSMYTGILLREFTCVASHEQH